jgi:CheY-like chemotaxis protein
MPRRPLILCVDDDWNGLEGRKMLFEEAGCKVLVATSGAEALQLFASHPVDLVLLDYHMPGINGDVVAEHMKAGEPDVPIALLSADDGLPESALSEMGRCVCVQERVASEPTTDCRAFTRSAFSICSARWFNGRARKTRSIRH